MGAVSEAIREKLTAALAPEHLEIIDDSARHAGHAGAGAAGESHFTVRVRSAAFEGLSRVERERTVLHLLAADLAGPVHALSLTLSAPGEG